MKKIKSHTTTVKSTHTQARTKYEPTVTVRHTQAQLRNTETLNIHDLAYCPMCNAQNPLNTFPRNFRVDGQVANLLQTCWRANKSTVSWQQVVVMEFG